MSYLSRDRKEHLIAELAEQAGVAPHIAQAELEGEEYDYFTALKNLRDYLAIRKAQRHQAMADKLGAQTKLRQTLRNMAYYCAHYFDLPKDVSENCLSVLSENARDWSSKLDSAANRLARYNRIANQEGWFPGSFRGYSCTILGRDESSS